MYYHEPSTENDKICEDSTTQNTYNLYADLSKSAKPFGISWIKNLIGSP